MKRNLIFWGTTISAGVLLVLLNVYVYQPEKKTITFFKIENHKLVPPKTIVHKHNTPKNEQQEKKDEKKQNVVPIIPQTPQQPKTIIPQNTENKIVTPKIYNHKPQFTKKPDLKTTVIAHNTKTDTKIEKDEIKELPFTQPLYHIKESKTEDKNEVKKPEVIYYEQKFFEYRHPLKTYFEQNTPHSQYLWIVDDKDYIHTTSQNSKIKLHNTVFVDKYGKNIQGDAVLEFKELLDGNSMFKANVNTSTDKKQKRAHQIWYINAKQKNKSVFLGANTVITIETQSKQELSFYIGKRNYSGEIEWKPVSKNQVEKTEILTTNKKQGKIYHYYCNLSELGWVAAFYEEDKEQKPVIVNVKSPSDVSPNEISVYYIDEKTNYPLYGTNQTSFLTSKRLKIAKKVKKYTQGNLFEGHIYTHSKGKIIAIGYDKGNYYFAQTNITFHKEQIELNLLPVKETEINQYICKD